MNSKIQNYYDENQDDLHKLFEDIESKIDGRICHSTIILLKILTELEDIKTYFEIGVHNGGSMALVLTCKNITNTYGIDLFEDMYNIDKHLNKNKFQKYQYFKRDNLLMEKTIQNLNKIKSENVNIKLIQGNSYFDETEDKFNKLKVTNLDMIFIDGDHTADGVKNDYIRYSKYVKKGGLIVFDDYHIPEIKTFCDNLIKNKKEVDFITKFKSRNSNAIDFVVRKL